MRLYIYKITKNADELKPDTFAFKMSMENAWFWTTRESADRAWRLFSGIGGINVKSPHEIGRTAPCTDFFIEPRPEGGFVISCEYPSSSD